MFVGLIRRFQGLPHRQCQSHIIKGGQPNHLVKKKKFGIFNIFLLEAVNKHPNYIKMKFEGDLTSIMVTRDFFVTATATLFDLTWIRKWLWCGWQS